MIIIYGMYYLYFNECKNNKDTCIVIYIASQNSKLYILKQKKLILFSV